jgi:glyoxylase I family protein
MRPLGIHHVNITVGDMVTARRFYLDELGGIERTDRPDFGFDGAWIDVGPQQIHLIVGEPAKNTNGDHFAIAVEDLAAAIEEMRGYGHKVSDAIPVGRAQQAFLRDPWGNRIELQQPAS